MRLVAATSKSSWERTPRRHAGAPLRPADGRGLAVGLVKSGLSWGCPRPELLTVFTAAPGKGTGEVTSAGS